MGSNIFEKLEEWIKNVIIEGVQKMIINANNTIGDIIDVMSENITDTPQSWNQILFTRLENISKAAIVPIAIGIMAIIICYDLITACIDKNNMKDFDIAIFFKFIIKSWIAIYFVNNAFTITGAIFEIGSKIADTALTTLFNQDTKINEFLVSEEFTNMLSECSLFDLCCTLGLSVSAYTLSLVVMIIVLIVTAGRMIETLIYFCGAPIPFATMTNREWSNVGFSFIKNMFALALQAFFTVIIIAIYRILFNTNVTTPSDLAGLTGSLLQWICYSVICCFALLKTGNIAKSICGAH